MKSTASTVGSAAMEATISASEFATAAVEATISATESAAIKATVLKTAAPTEAASPVNETRSSVKTSSIEPAAVEATAVETGTSVKTMEPRTGANEHAAHKVIRTVVAVRSASVRVIAVITVGADRRGFYVTRAHSNSNCNLRMRRSCRHQRANRQ